MRQHGQRMSSPCAVCDNHRNAMPWYELTDPNDPKLNELAQTLGLHPLYIEDVRSPGERVKLEQEATYTFAILRPSYAPPADDKPDAPPVTPTFSKLSAFAGTGPDGQPFFLTIADPTCPATAQALTRALREPADAKPARLLYLILDTIVDNYFPVLDALDDQIDTVEDEVISSPEPTVLQAIFALKRRLIDLRRVLVNTRDATLHLQRDPNSIIDAEHQPFVRDIYDHVARLLDSVDTERDLLNNALDIYLSSVANRTNEVMKVLTVISTIALPALAITGIYGMNLKGLPFENSPHGAAIVAALTLAFTLVLLYTLRRRRWL